MGGAEGRGRGRDWVPVRERGARRAAPRPRLGRRGRASSFCPATMGCGFSEVRFTWMICGRHDGGRERVERRRVGSRARPAGLLARLDSKRRRIGENEVDGKPWGRA